MGRQRVKPELVVNSYYGGKDVELVFKNFIKAVILGNEELKSSLYTIATSNFVDYNAQK